MVGRGQVERGAGRGEDRRQQCGDADRDEPAEEAGAPVDAAELVTLARPRRLQRVVRGRAVRRDRRPGRSGVPGPRLGVGRRGLGARGPLVDQRPVVIGRRGRALGDGRALAVEPSPVTGWSVRSLARSSRSAARSSAATAPLSSSPRLKRCIVSPCLDPPWGSTCPPAANAGPARRGAPERVRSPRTPSERLPRAFRGEDCHGMPVTTATLWRARSPRSSTEESSRAA